MMLVPRGYQSGTRGAGCRYSCSLHLVEEKSCFCTLFWHY